MIVQKSDDEGRLFFADRDAAEKIIMRIPALFWTESRQHIDTFSFLLA
jgi:hypothetical protein